MDSQMDKLLVDTETKVSDTSLMNDNNKQTRDDLYDTSPNDLFPSNDQDDMTQQLVQNNDDAGLEDETEEENDDLLDDTSTQTSPGSDAVDFLDTTMDGNDDTLDTDDDTSVALDDGDEKTGLDTDTNEVNFLGEDMEESILDSPAGINMDETQQDSAITGDELQQQQRQDEEEEEDETVEKTWDMDGDNVDDDQENSSVDALLAAGEDSFDDTNNSDNVIDDNTFVVDELVDNNDINYESSTTGDVDGGQYDWNNKNVDSGVQEDGQQQTTWNEDDDNEAEAEEEQEETMEQGTVEENENDRLGATLEHALDALELEQDTATTTSSSSSIAVDSGDDIIVDDLDRAKNGVYDVSKDDTMLTYNDGDSVDKSASLPLPPPPPHQQQQDQATSLGLDSTDDLTSVDTSLVLLMAVFILLCLRLPYVKRFFVKFFKSQESATLPYHTTHSKELD